MLDRSIARGESHSLRNGYNPPAARLPFISIVIPTRDRERQLEECLRSIAASDYPPERFEVIVVDDGGRCPPRSLIASFRDRLDLTLVVQPHGGPGIARNRGAALARGDLLVFTDDDCMLALGFLRALARRFTAAPDRAIGGRTVNALPTNLYSTASQALVTYLYDYYNADDGRARFFASNNLAVPAAGFRAIGGFDASLHRAAGEDREFCDRWISRGYPMGYASEAVVFHAHPLDLGGFCRQHFKYGRGAVDFHRARARDGRGSQTFEPVSFYLNLLSYPLRHSQGWRAAIIFALLVITQVANLAGYCWERVIVRAQSDPAPRSGGSLAVPAGEPMPGTVSQRLSTSTREHRSGRQNDTRGTVAPAVVGPGRSALSPTPDGEPRTGVSVPERTSETPSRVPSLTR